MEGVEEEEATVVGMWKTDLIVLLKILEATTFQGKAGAVQYLRMYHAFEKAINDDE